MRSGLLLVLVVCPGAACGTDSPVTGAPDGTPIHRDNGGIEDDLAATDVAADADDQGAGDTAATDVLEGDPAEADGDTPVDGDAAADLDVADDPSVVDISDESAPADADVDGEDTSGEDPDVADTAVDPDVDLAGVICGDGAIEGPEECDDGNLVNLDGCHADCRYEQVQRVINLDIEGGSAPAFCASTGNAFGNAFSALGRLLVNNALDPVINEGNLNILFQLLDLDDSLGRNDAELSLGLLTGTRDPDGTGLANDLDHWYWADPGTIDSNDEPMEQVAGSIVDRALSTGETSVVVPLLAAELPLTDALLRATISQITSPPSPPPTTLREGFESFNQLMSGQLCGNLTIGALSAIPVLDTLAAGGGTACLEDCLAPGGIQGRSYTACDPGQPVGPGCNSMLDVFVGGCVVNRFDSCVVFVFPTQPDVGDGDPLEPNPVTAKVTVDDPDRAYSTYLTFGTRRIHLTNNY